MPTFTCTVIFVSSATIPLNEENNLTTLSSRTRTELVDHSLAWCSTKSSSSTSSQVGCWAGATLPSLSIWKAEWGCRDQPSLVCLWSLWKVQKRSGSRDGFDRSDHLPKTSAASEGGTGEDGVRRQSEKTVWQDSLRRQCVKTAQWYIFIHIGAQMGCIDPPMDRECFSSN